MMRFRCAIGAAWAALFLAAAGAPALSQQLQPNPSIPFCEDPDVFAVASAAVTEAHAKSNFAGLGTQNKIIEAMRFMIEYEPTFEVQPTIEMLAARAEYGPENVRACMTSEWTFNERALVFIMLNPDSMEDWGLFMFNAGLDLPIAAGWLAVQPAE